MRGTGSAGSREAPAASGPRGLGYEPALDGVRGAAVLAVLLFHASSLPSNGWLGVDIFFVLSGFLITVLLLGEWQQRGRISLRRFFVRRALRLFPALGFMLLVFLGGSLLLYSSDRLDRAQLVENARSTGLGASYASNVVLAWSSDRLVPALAHLWSLGMEEQFYLVWPFALLFFLRRRVPARGLLLIVGAAIVIVVGHRLELVLTGGSQWHVFFAPDTQSDGILVGCLAGIAWANDLIPRPLRTESGRRRILFFGGWFVLAVIWAPIPYFVVHGGVLPLFEATVALLLLAVLLTPESGLAQALKRRYLVGIGKISYALYLWHPVVFVTLGVRAGLPLAFGLAWLSYRFVERPFLRRKRRLAASPPVLIPDAQPVRAT